ncbi:uncharacterized protein A1O9_09323 [Exophiala aquamarina CBS 119918]|uniref:NAD(P)-binding domain-containing protein n=1 Tax=Exophiala aquamarina CBS 119918 TaxID=1182545 RepID=A0A072PH85_9EURO|nr:uncharacterized protein A1O9_09323 [Exophiala aquamarina CBS 119918]KEF54880.1 hypothetical protein A1O9_09323 [Exophiala aquamarina CBS 119918]
MAASKRVLVLGGHGKIAMLLQPKLLAKNWNVTSVVRNRDHEAEIKALGEKSPGEIDVLVESLEDVKDAQTAQIVLDKVKPDVVIWSAGAGGKGGASRTKAVDEVAAKAYISASLATPSISKFLLVSYIASRKGYPPWWSDEDKKAADHVNNNVLPDYFKAKVEADEHLEALTQKRLESGDKSFQSINLRPGTLSDDPPSERVSLGKTSSRGKVSRETVANVALALLLRDDTRGWFDLLDGSASDPTVDEAIDELVKSGHNGLEGEDLKRIHARST